jgi:hypothetical protein
MLDDGLSDEAAPDVLQCDTGHGWRQATEDLLENWSARCLTLVISSHHVKALERNQPVPIGPREAAFDAIPSRVEGNFLSAPQPGAAQDTSNR